ncbi:hexose transporter-like protein [Talaromyces proteolyticus]|uniref:Hexose transporter-like protein n=1 Tax=Talaromyces proteolyticus TaxID=1131652 RepID=A0AAD4KJ11_9EURO|nr:hexose transporter-like protein [Talaromyces proteolyticus]KAH8689438.1 hexose transporter-like protein [Talaromyces proteolyticus]
MAGHTLQRRYVSRLVPKNPKITTVLLLAAAVVNSATLGYDSSMLNGLNILPQYKEYFHLNTATTGLNTAASWIGSILGCFLIQPVPDYFGRKTAILVSAIICFVGCIIQSAAQNIVMFVVGRIIVGLGAQISSGACPVLIGEILPPSKRGFVLGFFFSCFYVGSLVAAGINYRFADISNTWSWRIPSILQCVPSLLSILILPFIPESPRWLLLQGKREEAKEILAVVNGEDDIDNPQLTNLFNNIDAVLTREKEKFPRNPWIELVSTKANLRRLGIIISFGVMIELLGNFVISYYLGNMLTLAGITDPTTQLQINVILSCWSLVVAIVGSFLLDIWGRRPQTLTAIVCMIVSLFIFGGLTKVYGTGQDKSGIYGTIAMLFLFQGFYSIAITPMTSVYPTEVLPIKIRNAGIAVFRFLDSGFGLMASFSMSFAMENLGWKFYFINAAYNLVFLGAVYFLWVETARVPLEEVLIQERWIMISTAIESWFAILGTNG